ncbi:hypothetical protein [Enterococcus cecorum]|uniref:hypothetical protein n=1 Tax=Enterococcus cecorum TaxID=44008 RepID=UPI00148DBD17|nr:hypothetical protein [Enterococcus cecorum]
MLQEKTNLKELQKVEAGKRMKMLKLDKSVIKEFLQDGTIFYSERPNSIFQAVLYYASDDEQLERKVKEFEEEYNALVYHVQLTHTVYGKMYSFLYVSKSEDEWALDIDDLKNNCCYAFVWNNEIEDIGLIGIKPAMGGIVRTY